MNPPVNKKVRKDRTSLPSKPSPLPPTLKNGKAQRINRILSLAGLTSRRKADDWIRSGRVTVNGRPVTELGTRAAWGSDSIQVDGREIPKPSPRIYLMLNKPFGYVCTLKDPEGRHLVTELLEGITQRVYPVGRLDFDSLGLLLFTNDGECAYRLTHPKYQVPRTYKVTVEGKITEAALGRLREGVQLEDGPSGQSKTTLIKRGETHSIIRTTITQGRSRQVRRMLAAVGYNVIHLMRTDFGKLRLGDLKVGEYRFLEKEEVDVMKRVVGLI
ncbi:MAG: rRNA pseudouridine synthase [Deltaproteobacteria bacterium]|nr:rRNA pseudouridine synthase [Deltaproteobacteria bacterium]